MEFKEEAENLGKDFPRFDSPDFFGSYNRWIITAQLSLDNAYEKGLDRGVEIANRVGVLEAPPDGEYERGWHRSAKNIKKDILALKRPAGENPKGYCKEPDCEGH